MDALNKFRLNGKVAIITGGAGLLGAKHAEVVLESGGIAVLWDIREEKVLEKSRTIAQTCGATCYGMSVDITDPDAVRMGLNHVLSRYYRVDILVNNAANDPKAGPGDNPALCRIENLSIDSWQQDIEVGLSGAFYCSQAIGTHMAANGGGVILNISSDLGIIAPDQRVYRKAGLGENRQPVKPVTYSVVKHGLIGLTKYLATYWAGNHIRVNSISPGGVYTNQSEEFTEKLTNLIPMSRMAEPDEYKAAVLFLVSDASSYMTGANLVIDGGRTCW